MDTRKEDSAQSENDLLENKLEEIKAVFGIKTTTKTTITSSVIEDIRGQLERIENQLRKDRWALWCSLTLLQLGFVLIVAGGATWWYSFWTLTVTGLGIIFMAWGYRNFQRYHKEIKKEGMSLALSPSKEIVEDTIPVKENDVKVENDTQEK